MLLYVGYSLVALGLILEGISLYCLYRMWTRGRLLINVKYELIDRILHYPKLLSFPIGLTWVAIFWFALKWYVAVAFFAVVYISWIILTILLATAIAMHYAHKQYRAAPEPPPRKEKIPQLEPLEGPRARIKAHPAHFGKPSSLRKNDDKE